MTLSRSEFHFLTLLLSSFRRSVLLFPAIPIPTGLPFLPFAALDYIPFLSQVKSTIQVILGDFDGAAETQKNFISPIKVLGGVVNVKPNITNINGDIKNAPNDKED